MAHLRNCRFSRRKGQDDGSKGQYQQCLLRAVLARMARVVAGMTPQLHRMGEAGLLAEFSTDLTLESNGAALAFRAALAEAALPGVEEVSSTLKSVFVRFDPEALPHEALEAQLSQMLTSQDWFAAPLPEGRRLWRLPTAFGGAEGPQLGEVADLAGLSEAQTIEAITAARLRVLTMGFAPGQPYLGQLPHAFDIPRQSALTPQVPRGAVVLAIRQIVLFAVSAPTGWRQVGLSSFRCFRPDADPAIALRPGDEVCFVPASADDVHTLRASGVLGGEAELIA